MKPISTLNETVVEEEDLFKRIAFAQGADLSDDAVDAAAIEPAVRFTVDSGEGQL